MRVFADIEEFRATEGKELGTSEWLTVEQDRVNTFAHATDDHQWIHVDPVRAAEGPHGATIAHGYLTLSLLPVLVSKMYRVEGVRMAVNCGLNKVRFITPVRVQSRVRASSVLNSVREIEGGIEFQLASTIEIEDSEKPACVAQTITRYYA
jgi:acyl dehydratase